MSNPFAHEKLIDFGSVPPFIDGLLQEGVAAYRVDRARADRLFREALYAAPHALPVYYCLYKTHTYQGSLDEALSAAMAGLAEAARQADWSTDWHAWEPQPLLPEGPGRFALYTLKALAFIHLRRNEREAASAALEALTRLDPRGEVGWPVIAALAEGLG
jgi:hypothetical protein